jgi:hypothetical protein
MAMNVPGAGAARAPGAGARRMGVSGARTDETTPAFRTTELMAFVVAAAAVAVAGVVAHNLGARDVWLYITILTVGYMVSRGLAKSGSYRREGGATGDGG